VTPEDSLSWLLATPPASYFSVRSDLGRQQMPCRKGSEGVSQTMCATFFLRNHILIPQFLPLPPSPPRSDTPFPPAENKATHFFFSSFLSCVFFSCRRVYSCPSINPSRTFFPRIQTRRFLSPRFCRFVKMPPCAAIFEKFPTAGFLNLSPRFEFFDQPNLLKQHLDSWTLSMLHPCLR